MQMQRNSNESIPEPLQIDCGSNPSSTSMDQPFYGSNVLLNSVETPTLADYLLSSNNPDIDYINMPPRETDALNIWDSREPNTSGYTANHQTLDPTKMDQGWSTSLSINSAVGERNNLLTLDNMELNLNNTPADDGHTFTQRLNSSHQNQRMEENNSEIVEVSLCPFLPNFFESEHSHSLNSHGSSSNGAGQTSEDDRTRSSVNGLRISCKRKNIEGAIGESSTSCNMPSSSRYLPTSNYLEANQTPSFNPLHRGVCSDWNAETQQRNFRTRLNPPMCQHDMVIPPFQSHSAVTSDRLSTIWSSGDSTSLLNSYNSSAEQSHPHMLAHNTYPQRRLNLSPEEMSVRSFPRNDIGDQSAFITRSGVGYLSQETPNWNPLNSSLSVSGNRPSSSSGVIQSPGSIRAQSEMVPSQFHRNLSEALRSSLFPSVGSESGLQSANLPSRQVGRSASVPEAGQSSRTMRQGYSPLYPRPAISIDRQRDAVSGLPLSARSRDGRNRMISEIRNALDLMRRGVNLRFEDVFIFDQSGLFGRADLHDRHRDMRLDVDNMSYEELLALEERIGYVNTGLSEETILKCLRQWKYSACSLEVALIEQEPCCICREDYSEEEEMGSLDCRHDFHAACIKHWLLIKNLCPICKTTALVT